MKWKPYHTDIFICAISGFVGLFIGDVVSYWLHILSLQGIVLGIVLVLPWHVLYVYSRKRAWLRKQDACERQGA